MGAVSTHSAVPQQFGVVLRLEPGADAEALRRLVAGRLGTVPRLRQRLVRVPPPAGRPVWVDDPAFDAEAHVRRLTCPTPGDEPALLDLAVGLVCARLDRARPRWSAAVVEGLADGGLAVVVVIDHVVSDGIGGLAVLARLADPGPPGDAAAPPPRPRPSYRALVADAARTRWSALRRAPGALRALRGSFRAGGGLHPPRAATCSLLAPTGNGRRFGVARTDLTALHAAAAELGGTVNDAVLVAVSTALRDLLAARGESVPEFQMGIVVTGRRSADLAHLGNVTSPLLVPVPSGGPAGERMRRIAGVVRRERDGSARSAALAVLVVRLAAGTGLYRRWLRSQRRLHTLVSNVPGPPGSMHLGGLLVTGMVPIAVGDSGNVTVSFACLSYAGTLSVTAAADPEQVPDLPALVEALQAGLDELAAPGVRHRLASEEQTVLEPAGQRPAEDGR
nr:wax ester/triacylglycerol synthase domain-containing protein [Petropleomorpha daqingensis]